MEPLRILVVDAEESSAGKLEKLIEQSGHEVCGLLLGVPELHEIIEVARKQVPHLILFDLDSQEEAGQPPHKLTALCRKTSLPILAVAGMMYPLPIRSALDAGAFGLLDKEVSPDELDRWLSRIDQQARTLKRLNGEGNIWPPLLESAGTGMYTAHPAGFYLAANRCFAQTLGYSGSGELLEAGVSLDQQVYAETGRRLDLLHLLRQGGTVREYESRVYRRDGTELWIAEYLSPVFSASGDLECYDAVVLRINERVQAAASEASALSLARACLESIPVCAAVTDLQGNIIMANRSFEREIGTWLGPERNLGIPFQLDAVPPSMQEKGWQGPDAGAEADGFMDFLEQAAGRAAGQGPSDGMLRLPAVPFELRATVRHFRNPADDIIGAIYILEKSS